MENTISFTLSPLQVLISLAMQIWLIIFPVLILRKLNELTRLLQGPEDMPEEDRSPGI